ncbi:metal ABC transporter solute-binding protein, Zn/Mn family [Candidatus Vondammii sp. HM_W22]|uniref:metal ABC transporter solute-binding protein, Zn/Mn family n=1 Tax=Candidatus Vondammii sp. HM_W22 TaxID=2687299 RepID=UPI001F141CB6|nr:zinc ABC transporter substrate-binding protein [Candidatus Vondammii sp. HM_W22]
MSLLYLSFNAFAVMAGESRQLTVFVSVLPQKYIVEQIGGEHVRVQVMVGPGQSPATFEPRPRQMALLARADLYYRIGVPFEEAWLDRILAANRKMSLLDAREGVLLREMEPAGRYHHDYDHTHHQGEHKDPHIWLNPAMVRLMAAKLKDRLIALDPVHSETYLANQARLDRLLIRLESDVRERLASLKNRKFMVFHPSWGYFADAFKLRQIPIESEGKEPGAMTLGRLIDQAKNEGIQVIFVQQQFSQRQAKALAQAIDGRVVAIDSLAEDYPANLRRVADAIAGANRRG